MRKVFIFMLCTALVLSSIGYTPVYATGEEGDPAVVQEEVNNEQEEGVAEEPVTGQPEQEDETVQSDIPEPQAEREIKKITVDKKNISFGTITKGDEVSPQIFTVKNEGNTPIQIKWSQADSSKAFDIEAMSDINKELAPGDGIDFQVSFNGADAGDYTSNIVVQDADDYANKVAVSVSVKVKEAPAPEPELVEEPEKTPEQDPQITKEPATEEPIVEEPVVEKPETPEPEEQNTENKENPQDEVKPENTQPENKQPENKQPENKPAQTPTEDSNKGNTQPSENTEKQNKTGEVTGIGQYNIKAQCNPKEGGYVSGAGSFDKGKSTVLTAYENDGFRFIGWYRGDEKLADSYSISVKNIGRHDTFTARFQRVSFKISAKSSNEKYGTVSGGKRVKRGEKVVLSAAPKKGYELKGWYENDKLVSKDAQFTVSNITADHKYVAAFKASEHSVKVSVYPKDAGKTSGTGTYRHNSEVKLSAAPNNGYVFKAFVLNNQILSYNENYTLKDVNKDLSITAYFEKVDGRTYKMKSGVSNKGGFISPSGELTMAEGGEITYIIAPDNGYAIQEVSVDGKKVGPVTSYTFKNIHKDHSISVAFAPKKGNENGVKKDKIITTAEAKKYAVAKLDPAELGTEGRKSEVVTPEMYQKMKQEGTLDEALEIPEQSVVGMDDTKNLSDTVDDYNYDTANGLYQILDITPEEAEKMVKEGEHDEIIRKAYEAGLLNIVINNQYMVPGQEEKINDNFEDDATVKNMLEFVSGTLDNDDGFAILKGQKVTVTLGITKGDDFEKADKEALEKSGAKADECFYITVMKEREGGDPVLVTELERPVKITLQKPEGSAADCVIRLHADKAEVLEDLDDNPNTITVETDRFSPYAFGEKGMAENKTVTGTHSALPIIFGIAAAIALIGGVIFALTRRSKNE